MLFSCYADQVTGNISDVMVNYHCVLDDTTTVIGLVFLFIILIALWKKILWK